MTMQEEYLQGVAAEAICERAKSMFEDVLKVDLSLTLNDIAFSGEDTWHMMIECDFVDLNALNEFTRIICDGFIDVDIVAIPSDEHEAITRVCINFHGWKSVVGDRWGTCPELEQRNAAQFSPWPGMEFEAWAADAV